MLIVAEIKGKQYKLKPGDKIKVEKINGKVGDEIVLDKILLFANDNTVEIGTPYLDKKIKARILAQGKTEKKIVFKYKPKTRYRKKKGHRQPYTEIEILKSIT